MVFILYIRTYVQQYKIKPSFVISMHVWYNHDCHQFLLCIVHYGVSCLLLMYQFQLVLFRVATYNYYY